MNNYDDDSESEDEEDSKADYLDYREMDEELYIYGATRDQSSDGKSDQGSKSEAMETADKSQMVMTSDVRHFGITESKGVSGNGQPVMPTMPPITVYEQPVGVIDQIQRELQQDYNHSQCDETPND